MVVTATVLLVPSLRCTLMTNYTGIGEVCQGSTANGLGERFACCNCAAAIFSMAKRIFSSFIMFSKSCCDI